MFKVWATLTLVIKCNKILSDVAGDTFPGEDSCHRVTPFLGANYIKKKVKKRGTTELDNNLVTAQYNSISLLTLTVDDVVCCSGCE